MADEDSEGMRVAGKSRPLRREVLVAANKVIGVGETTDEVDQIVHKVCKDRPINLPEIDNELSNDFDNYYIKGKGPSELLLSTSLMLPATSALCEDYQKQHELHEKDLSFVATKLHITTDVLRHRIFRNYQLSKKHCKVKIIASSPSLSVQRQNQSPKVINCAKVFAAEKLAYDNELKLQTYFTPHDVNGQNSFAVGSPDLPSQFWEDEDSMSINGSARILEMEYPVLKINGNGSISVMFNEKITCMQKFDIVIVQVQEQVTKTDKRLSNVLNCDAITNYNVWPRQFTEKLRPAPQTSRRIGSVSNTIGTPDFAENIKSTPLGEGLRGTTNLIKVLTNEKIKGVRVARKSRPLRREVLVAARKVDRIVHKVCKDRPINLPKVDNDSSNEFDNRVGNFIKSKGPRELLPATSLAFPVTASLCEDLQKQDELNEKDLHFDATKLHISTDVLRGFRNYQLSKKQIKVNLRDPSPPLNVINCAKAPSPPLKDTAVPTPSSSGNQDIDSDEDILNIHVENDEFDF